MLLILLVSHVDLSWNTLFEDLQMLDQSIEEIITGENVVDDRFHFITKDGGSMNHMIKIVFFDFDGVLTLNGHACNEISSYLEPVAGVEVQKIEPIFHEVAKKLLVNGKRYKDYIDYINEKIGSSLTAEDILSAIGKSKLNSDMLAIVRELHQKDVAIGIITDNNIERLEMIRSHTFFGTLSPIVGSAETSCTKDKCEIVFRDALNLASVNPKEAIFIDDKTKCLTIAKKLGINTFHYDGQTNDADSFRTFLRKYELL